MSRGPAPVIPLTVRGGRGGTTARLDDLDRLAALLLGAGACLDELTLAVAGVARDGSLLVSALHSPLTAARAELELADALLGRHGLAGCALHTQALGVAVGAAARAYRAVDSSVAEVLHQVDVTAGRLVGVVVLAGIPSLCQWQAGAALGARIPLLPRVSAGSLGSAGRHGSTGSGWTGGERLVEFLARHTTVAEHLVDAVPGMLDVLSLPFEPRPGLPPPAWAVPLESGCPPRDVRDAARQVAGLAAVSPLLHEPVTVRVTSTAGRPGRPPSGLGDVFGTVAGLSPGQRRPDGTIVPPGTVRVQRITGPQGDRSWIVEIPGTHVWQPVTGPDPFDVTSAVNALSGRSSAAGATVVEALRSAGAQPQDPVLLAGHSLGGMVAAQLAADPALRGTLHITHVVTAGSPVALAGVPPGVHLLSIEHTDDLVPRLDGAENPDRPGWVTVSRPATDLPTGPGPGSEQTGDDAHPRLELTHDAGGYARTAALIDASADPSVAAWRSELAPFLDRPGATATSWDVSGRRILVPVGGGR